MPSYRAALIGCGNISGRHARAYFEQGNVQLVAACDINPENLNITCDQLNISGRYASHQDLFRHEREIDLVSVCTYPKVHAEQTIAAANAGAKAVLCEKPMCLSLDDADAHDPRLPSEQHSACHCPSPPTEPQLQQGAQF